MLKICKKIKDKYLYRYFWKKECSKEERFANDQKEILYLKKWYKSKTHDDLDISNPVTYNEKIQWLKLFGNLEQYTDYADKLLVREYVSNIIGEQYLIPIISVNGKQSFTHVKDIDFNSLPNKFVIQCNHGAHMTHIVKDKKHLNINRLSKILTEELNINFAYGVGYEKQYKNINRKVFITEYLEESNSLVDYKFFFFDGKLDYFSVDEGRFANHKRSIYLCDGTLAPFQCKGLNLSNEEIDINAIKEMIQLATKLANGFRHVRVDMYYHNNQIYFGELTFTPGSGIARMRSHNDGLLMGKKLNLETYSLKIKELVIKFNIVDYLMVLTFMLRCQKELEWNKSKGINKWQLDSINPNIIRATYNNKLTLNIKGISLTYTDTEFKDCQPKIYRLLYSLNTVTNLKYEYLDPVYLEHTLGMDLPYITKAIYKDVYLDDLKAYDINRKLVSISNCAHYKYLKTGELNINTRTNLTNQTNHDRFKLLKDFDINNYGDNNNSIIIYNDDMIIRDGTHRASILYNKHGNIKVKVLNLIFDKNYLNFDEYYKR